MCILLSTCQFCCLSFNKSVDLQICMQSCRPAGLQTYRYVDIYTFISLNWRPIGLQTGRHATWRPPDLQASRPVDLQTRGLTRRPGDPKTRRLVDLQTCKPTNRPQDLQKCRPVDLSSPLCQLENCQYSHSGAEITSALTNPSPSCIAHVPIITEDLKVHLHEIFDIRFFFIKSKLLGP